MNPDFYRSTGTPTVNVLSAPADTPTDCLRGSSDVRNSDCSKIDTDVTNVMGGRLVRSTQPSTSNGFAGFELVSELGRGTFGQVYLARQRELAGRTVVLKVGRHLREEIDALAQLQHPNVVPVYSFHRDGDRQALCMPFVGTVTAANVVRQVRSSNLTTLNGQALRTIITKCRTESGVPAAVPTSPTLQGGPTTEPGNTTNQASAGVSTTGRITFEKLNGLSYIDAVIWIGRQLARGLGAAHERAIIHSDLKPANILLADDGQPMLIDFGVAFDRKAHVDELRIGGTRPYMSPEHLRSFLNQDRIFDERSDLYSLGVILFELLTGKLPFSYSSDHDAGAILTEIESRSSVPSLESSGRAFAPAIESIIRTCLAADPAERYQTAKQLEDDLTRQLDRRPLAFAPNTSRRELVTKWVSRNRWGIAAAVAVTSLGSSALAYERHDRGRRESLATVAADKLADERLALLQQWQQKLLSSPTERDEAMEASLAEITKNLDTLPPAKAAMIRENTIDLLLAKSRTAIQNATGKGRSAWLEKAAEWNRQAGELLEQPNRGVLAQRAHIEQLHGTPNAATAAERAKAIPLDSARAERIEGQELMERGRWREAVGHLTAAGERDPGDFWTAFSLGQCKYRMGRDAEAIAAFDLAEAIDPSINGVCFNRGMASLRLRKFAQAEADFSKVIEFKSDWPEPYLNRANAREGQNNLEGAIRDLTTAMDRGYPRSAVLLTRARLYAKAGRPDLAAADRQAGLAAEPTDDRGYCARGGALMPAKGITDPAAFVPALTDFEKALAINPKSLVALQMKARVYSISQQNQKAIAALTNLLTHFPETADALSGRAMLYSREGNRTAAHADAVEALRVSGDNPRTVYQIAGVYAMTSKTSPDDAREALTLLASALRNNFGFEHLAGDRELDPIRHLPEFNLTIADSKRHVDAKIKASPTKDRHQ